MLLPRVIVDAVEIPLLASPENWYDTPETKVNSMDPESEGAYTCEVTSVSTSAVMSEPGYLVFQGATAPACPADLTDDGVLNFFDVSAFIQAFSAGCP